MTLSCELYILVVKEKKSSTLQIDVSAQLNYTKHPQLDLMVMKTEEQLSARAHERCHRSSYAFPLSPATPDTSTQDCGVCPWVTRSWSEWRVEEVIKVSTRIPILKTHDALCSEMLSTKVRNVDTSPEVLQGFDVSLMKVELLNFYHFCN